MLYQLLKMFHHLTKVQYQSFKRAAQNYYNKECKKQKENSSKLFIKQLFGRCFKSKEPVLKQLIKMEQRVLTCLLLGYLEEAKASLKLILDTWLEKTEQTGNFHREFSFSCNEFDSQKQQFSNG